MAKQNIYDEIEDLKKRVSDLETNAYSIKPKRMIGIVVFAIGLILMIGSGMLSHLIDTPSFFLIFIGMISFIVGIVLMASGQSKPIPKNYVVEDEEPEETPLPKPKPIIQQIRKQQQAAYSAPYKAAAKSIKKPSDSKVEADIGRKWFARIGIISLVLSVAFFIIYAIQNKLIGPTGQIAIGIFIGIILIVLGELFNRKEKYLGYARTLTGGGFAILYFAIYSAYQFYKLIPYEWLDLLVLSIVIILAVIFAIKYNSQVIAAEAFLMGYLAPIIIGKVSMFSLMYSLALSIGLAFICFMRNWTYLSYGGLAFTYIIHGIWLSNSRHEDTTFYNAMFIILYIAIFAIFSVFTKHKEDKNFYNGDILIYLSFIVAFLFLAIGKVQVGTLALFILLILASAFLFVKEKITLLPYVALIGAYICHIIWLSDNYAKSNFGVSLAFASIYFVLFNIIAFFNKDDISKTGLVLLNSFIYFGIILFPLRKFYPDYDGLFAVCLAIFYLIIAYVAYNLEKKYIFNTFTFLCLSYLTLAIPLQLNQNWVTISWAIEALLLLILSFRLKEDVIRILSTIIAGLTAGKLLVYDSWALGKFSSDILSSTRIFSFASVIIIFYIIAFIYKNNKKMFDNYDSYIKYVAMGYAIAATLFTTLIVTIEIMSTSGIGNLKQMWVSIAWIIQALILLVYGFSASNRASRIIGIAIFFVSICKIFLFDLSMLQTIYRIVSFFVLGVILLIAAFLYYKFRDYI